MIDKVERNRLQALHWIDCWNDDPHRMIADCYAADCVVENRISGLKIHGIAELAEIEDALLAFDGARRMELATLTAAEERVVLELIVHMGGTVLNACVVLTFGPDGRILSDHTYINDISRAD